MKTFKLKALEIIENEDVNIVQKSIPLLDGLIINREDDENHWVIEAYLNHSYFDFFKTLKEKENEIMVQVKISKESNEPAVFITSIIGVNKIGTQMNVLFKGAIIDQRKGKIEEMLRRLVEEGYQGESLLKEFKKQLKKD